MIKEKIKLKEEDMLDFIKGRKLIFHYHNIIEIELFPPKYGVTLTYDEWKELLAEFVPISSRSFDLIKEIENKF